MAVRARRRAVSDADKDVRRDEILSAAKRVFAAHGFHQTAIADVAKAAKLSYGTIYWYFDSKDALFRALTERAEQALWTHVATAVSGADGDDDPERTLTKGVRATFEFFVADPDAARLLAFDRFTDDIERLIVDAQHRGVVVDAPARILAVSVAAVISSIAGRVEHEQDFDPEASAEVVVSLLLNGLRRR